MIKEYILNKFEKVKPIGSSNEQQYECLCPVHNDKSPSLHIKFSNDSALFNCKCGCSTEEILKSVGLAWADIFEDKGEFKIDGRSKCIAYYVKEKGLKYVDEYIYYDESGNYLHHKFRFLRPNGEKTMRFAQIQGNSYTPKAHRDCTGIYRLEKLQDYQTVYVTEGEKDVKTLEKHGYDAVTTGGSSTWKRLYSKFFKDKDIIIMRDNDEAGLKYANIICKDLKGIAKSLIVVNPSTRPKGDVTDFFEDGYTVDDLNALVEQAINNGVEQEHENVKNNHFIYNDSGKVIPYYLAKVIAENHNIISDKISMYSYEDNIYKEVEPNAFKYIDNIIDDKQQVKINLINEVTGQIRNMTYRDEIETTRGYIHFNNGLFDVKSRQFVEPNKDIICFGKIPYNYDPKKADIRQTRFARFITSSLNEEMLPVIQELIGVCLYPITDKRAYFYVLYGEGRNGKGVLMDLMLNMIPKNLRSSIPIGGYDTRFINAAIKGKTLNICLDDKTSRLEEIGNFKSVTAGEEIYAEKKGQDGTTIKSILTHISAFNKLPSMNEKANAFFDRMIAIEFKTTFGTQEQVARGEKDELEDIHLKQDILENEMEIIVAWGLEGLFRIIDNDYVFTSNKELIENKESYRNEVDSVRQWALSNLIPIEGNFTNKDLIKAVDLFKRYKSWCEDEGQKPVGRNTFLASMKSLYRGKWKEVDRTLRFAVFNG